MIAQAIENALNQHINQEYTSWYFYRSAAAYCEGRHLRGFSKWFRHRSERKLHRATKLFDFVVERRGHVQLRPIEAPAMAWESPLAVLSHAQQQERRNADSAKKLVVLALEEGDYATNDFLGGFVAELAEAETKVHSLAQRLELMGDAPGGLFMLDRSLS